MSTTIIYVHVNIILDFPIIYIIPLISRRIWMGINDKLAYCWLYNADIYLDNYPDDFLCSSNIVKSAGHMSKHVVSVLYSQRWNGLFIMYVMFSTYFSYC